MKKIFKFVPGLMIVSALAAGLIYWGQKPHSLGGSGAEIDLEFEGTNLFIDGYCTQEYGYYCPEYSSYEAEVTYAGDFGGGYLEITVTDGNASVLYKKTITEPGSYSDSVSLHLKDLECLVSFRYSEGSTGSFSYEHNIFVTNYRYFFGIGKIQ